MVGVDVSLARLDVGVWPSGESFPIGNHAAGIEQLLARLLELRPGAVIVEASGGLEDLLVSELCAAAIPVARVNPRQVREFARSLASWPRPIGMMRWCWRSSGIRRIKAAGLS